MRVPRETEVLIVGGGPTGLIAANLLGSYGIATVLVERNAATSPEPRAILIDDGALRACQAAGLADAVEAAMLPGYGARYVDARGRVLAHLHPTAAPYGFARRNAFLQPALEETLARGLLRFPHVQAAFRTRLIDFRQDTSGVTATCLGPDGDYQEVRARLLLGCDGARSTVRDKLGIDMTGSSFAERWLVVDTRDDPDDARFSRFVCDPARPTVIVPAPEGGRRYEFMLLPDETPEAMLADETVSALLGRWRPVGADTVVRKAVHTFQALVAAKLRERRALLLGDAAHVMPPFAGQGMNAGFRDAFMLAWKAAAVARGEANPAFLDTYEAERRPNVQATIDLSVRLGGIVATTSRRKAWLRDRALRAMALIPPARDWVAEMQLEPAPRLRRGVLVDAYAAYERSWIGRPLPQPCVLADDRRRIRLDEALGGGWALLRFDRAPEVSCLAHPVWSALAPRLVTVLTDDRTPRPSPINEAVVGDDGRALAPIAGFHGGQFLLVRPDRYVAAAFDAEGADATAEALARLLDRPAGD